MRRILADAGLVVAAMPTTLFIAGGLASAGVTTIDPYAVSMQPGYTTRALLSVGDTVPETSDPTKSYRMVGIPDGLGAYRNPDGTVTLYMNHEFNQWVRSQAVVDGPLYRGAFVSKLLMTSGGVVLSAERAYDTVYINDTLIGPAADTTNATPGFARFCSGSLADHAHGFDRPIYFANEESGAPATFDGLGGLAVAIFDNEAHGLPDLGRFPWENTLVQPNFFGIFGNRTVIMGMEDGPFSQNPADENSQLYMYIGHKDHGPGATTLERNGLVGGTLYVFRAIDPNKNSEALFTTGTIVGQWVPIPNAGAMSQAQLEAASDAVGAMIFARPEDGAFNPRNRNHYFFVTTGGATGANELGRLYSLHLNPFNPAFPAVLRIEYNADQVVAAGGDTALSPDNIDTSLDYLMICEDGTTQSRLVMAAYKRDGSIWRFPLQGFYGVDTNAATRMVELDPPGRDGIPVGPGVWETSGIIDGTGLFGPGTWLFDVQAHSPTTAPAPKTVEDGQLLLPIPD